MQFDHANPLTVVQNGEEKRTEEEQLLEDDMFSASKRKKKTVRIDLSDSEEEKDQDDDMFESDKEDEDKKGVEALDMNRFERELKNEDESELPSLKHQSPSDDDDDDDMFKESEEEEEEEEEELEDEEENPEPKMDSFNLKSDMDEGVFDAEGNFIRHAADEKDYQDAWLRGVSKKDIRKAKEAHKIQEAQSSKKKPVESVKTLALRLASVLAPDQTPIQALKANAKSTNTVDFITELCTSLLIDHDVTTIYDKTKGEIEALGGLVSHDSKKRKRTAKQYILKWSSDPQEHGPFDEATMAAWLDDGYFDSGDALCKPTDTPDAQFANPLNLSFD